MSEALGHLIHYRTPDGNWVAIPYGIVDIYDYYVAYCKDNGIAEENIVTKDTYYRTLGSLAGYINDLNNLIQNLGDVEAVKELTDTLGAGVLPTTMGGTGANFTDYNAFIKDIESKIAVTDFVRLAEFLRVKKLLDTKLDSAAIEFGDEAPSPDLDALYYFQYE